MRHIALALSLSLTCAVWADQISPDRIRDAAARGLVRIQASQAAWFGKQSCNSCHQQILPQFALRAAHEHGIPYDHEQAQAHAAKTYGILSNVDRAVQYNYIIDPAGGEAWMLVAADEAGVAPSLTTAIYARHVARRQKADGHWVIGDNRPPQSYSNVMATAIVTRAIQKYSHASMAAEVRHRVARARGWLSNVSPATTEERTYQLFGLSWAGAESDSIQKAAKGLLEKQQDDGGWNALPGRKSDAYSTAEALASLHEAAHVAVSDPSWQRGLEYLLKAQAADGTWHVASRLYPPAVVSPPYFDAGYPYGHDQFISMMAASWAVRAMADALPSTASSLPPIPAANPSGVEPWVETALFGTADEVRALLDRGLSANAATKAGGTTLLMMVQPDAAKTKLLLDRGADVNARAKTKYSALLVASVYPNSAEAIRTLVKHGAMLSLPKGQGAPMFNAVPLVLAATTGDVELVPALVSAGAKPADRMWVLGLFQATATAQAVGIGDAAMTKALLDVGADPNETDSDGFSLLYMSIVGNRHDIARLLLDRGAKINAVDQRHMTPLLYAVSADYGDPAMVDLLLARGADRSLRNAEGLTAADLAQKYHHSYLEASLAPHR